MRHLLRETWTWFQNLIKSPPPPEPFPTWISLRDKSIAVARGIISAMDRGSSTLSCPLCLSIWDTHDDADPQMTLAVHLMMWHRNYVLEQWNIMQRETHPVIRPPFVIAGVGVAAALGALIAISAINRAQQRHTKAGG